VYNLAKEHKDLVQGITGLKNKPLRHPNSYSSTGKTVEFEKRLFLKIKELADSDE
jgi:hypothetical protein